MIERNLQRRGPGAAPRFLSRVPFRFAAVLLLAAAGCRDPAACDRLVENLQRAGPQNLAGLVRAVKEAGQADQAADRLVPLLAARRSSVRAAAATALGELGADSAPVASGLTQALQDHDPHVRAAATIALGKIGPLEEQTTAAIVAMRDDRNPLVRDASVEALVGAGPAAKAAVPMLILALQDPQVGRLASEALGAMGEAARDATPALVRASRSGDPSARASACRALWRITRDARLAAAPLPDLLKEDVFLPVRMEAADLAAEIGPPASPATEQLIDMLGSDNEPAARSAAAALASIGKEAIPRLESAAASSDPTRRQFAVLALGRMTRAGHDVRRPLVKALQDKAWLVRLTAVRVLASSASDRETPPLLDALRFAADDPHPFVRPAAAGARDMLAEKRGRTSDDTTVPAAWAAPTTRAAHNEGGRRHTPTPPRACLAGESDCQAKERLKNNFPFSTDEQEETESTENGSLCSLRFLLFRLTQRQFWCLFSRLEQSNSKNNRRSPPPTPRQYCLARNLQEAESK